MRRSVLLLSSLLPVLLSAQVFFESQGPPLTPPASNTPPEQKCVVQGRVSNAQSGEPLKKATLRLTRHGPGAGAGGTMGAMPASGFQGYSATSEADGSFRIEAIEPGDYTLSGQRTGYLNTQYGAKSPMQPGTVLSLQPGQQMTDIALGLTPQAVISGKVVDPDGDPVPNAMVQVLGQQWQRGKLRYFPHNANQTNDLGEFRLANLSPGKYYVCAQKMNFQMAAEPAPEAGKPDIRPIRTCYPEATVFENATPIQVSAGQDASGMDIRLHTAQTYHVRGRVVGVPPAGEAQRTQIFVTHQDEQQMFFMGAQATMAKDQTFDIAGVAPGSYMVNVVVAMQGPMRTAGRQQIEVGQGDVNDVVITLSPPGSLHGQIRIDGSPQAGSSAANLANVHVSLAPAEPGSIMSFPNSQSKPDGSFTLDNISPGKYYVQANAPNGTYLKSVRFGQQEVLGKELDLSNSASGDLELVFRFGAAEVDGTVQAAQTTAAPAGSSSTGQPASGSSSSIVLVPDVLNADGSGMHFGNANQSGSFTIRQVTPGHYRAYAFEQANIGELQNPDVLKQLESRGTDVDLKENDKKQIQLPLISADELQQVFAQLGIEPQQ